MDHEWNADRYERMQYRRCGRSGLRLPAISLGAWETFGGYVNEETSRACLFRAFDLGITHFDFANNYGVPPGNAETVCGRIIKEMPRDELILSSKAGYHMWPGPYGEWGSKKYIVASCDQSLKRMGVDYFDIFYSHRPDPDTPVEETLRALDLLVRQGKALYIGVSNYRGAHFAESTRVCERMRLHPITIHQPRYNMLQRTIEWDLLPQTDGGYGRHSLLPAVLGPAHRQVPQRRYPLHEPRGREMGRRMGGAESERQTEGCPRSAQSNGKFEGPEPGPDGAGLDSPLTYDHERPHRRIQRPPA